MNFSKEQLLDIFQSNGLEVQERSTGDVCIDCPFCGNTKKKLWVKGTGWHCFRCEEHGNVFRLFRELQIKPGEIHLSTEDLRNKVMKAGVNKRFGVGQTNLLPQLGRTPIPPEFKEIRKSNKSHACLLAHKLLRKRGLEWSDARRWNIGYSESGKYLQHIIFPVQDEHHNIVTFQARRFLGNFDPKTKNPFDDGTTYSRTDALYGIQWMKPRDPIVIVEGPFDAIYLDKVFRLLGMRHKAIALLGHQISQVQIMYLKYFSPSAIWVMLDSDVKKECRQIGRELAGWFDVPVYITELEYGDPDDLTPEELLQNLQNSSRAKPSSNGSRRGPFAPCRTGQNGQ